MVLKKLLRDRKVNLDILVRRARDRGPSAYDYQIRTSPLGSLAEGADLCEVLKKAGHQSCLVVQHNDLLWKNLVTATDRRKASKAQPKGHTKVVVPKSLKGADAVNLIIELPSSNVMESGHISSFGSAGIMLDPFLPMVRAYAEI